MKIYWGDSLSLALIVVGGMAVFAKLENYSWWMIGSWKSALGFLSALGFVILLTNIVELVKVANMTVFVEVILWIITATVASSSLFSATTKTEFISTSILIALSWGAQFGRHIWDSSHKHASHFAAT